MINEYSNKRKSNLIVIISCVAIFILAIILRLQVQYEGQNIGEENNIFISFTNFVLVIDVIAGGVLLTLFNINFTKKEKRNKLFKENKKVKLLVSGVDNSVETNSNLISMQIPTYCKNKKITLKHIIPDDCHKVVITFAANQYNEWKVFLKRSGELKYCVAEGTMSNAQFDFSQKVTEIINIPENKTYDTISINVSNPEREEIIFNIYDLVAIRE